MKLSGNGFSIYKYKLTEYRQTINLPINSKILSVVEQYNDIVMYAWVNTSEEEVQECDVLMLGTGWDIPEFVIKNYKFLNTVNQDSGALIWHVFYKLV
jgi:hypothetical protein